MRKNFQIESRKDFRFSLYSRSQPIGLGESFTSILKRLIAERIKNKDQPKVINI